MENNGTYETVDVINTLVNDEIVVTNIRKVYVNNILNLVEYKNQEGKLHRDSNSPEGDGPAQITYNAKTEKIEFEKWYKDGKLHRDGDLPAIISYNSKIIIKKCWYKDGKLHRDGNLPALIKYNSRGKWIEEECWYKNGKLHRDGDLPALKSYRGPGVINMLIWFKKGKEYRDIKNGPARKVYMYGSLDEVRYSIDEFEIKDRGIHDMLYKLQSLDDEEYKKYIELFNLLKK